MKNFLYSILIITFLITLFTVDSYGIPSFSRKYQTSCSTCHYAFPMLNAFGEAFRNNGYRYPGGDENYRKEEPVSLGSEGYKRVWPDAIWPADIPGTSPLSALAIGRINYDALANVKWGFEIPHEVEVLYGGTIGEDFSFFGEVEFENENNEIEIAFPFALQYDHSPGLHLRVGMVNADPTPNSLRLTRNHYNIASFRSRNRWRFRDEKVGVELWGAGNSSGGSGGFTYRIGVVNGQGISDMNKEKDIYGRATYKFGGLGEIGGTEGSGSETSQFYIDNSLTLGAFFYKGVASRVGSDDEDFTIYGGDIDFWFERFIVNATVMLMNSDIPDTEKRKSLVYYAQGNYVLFPWLIGLVRYEWEDRDTDSDTVEPVNSIIPGISVIIRANVKFILEFKKFLDEANKKQDSFVLQINFGI
ncbi:MAG: hypothetical protein A2V93_06215 [Ignavibacteria bacterium RBG_16_34_14]|nr:MAG: hypothetical protein A2V93_06215 [Ignavibacteria bacterium RBG_16_34_14]